MREQKPKLSSRRFCDITASVAHNIKHRCRWGSAHCRHHLFIRSGKYLLVNEWNTNNYCSMYVVPDDAPPQMLCNHPRSGCGTQCGPWIPKEYIRVYDDGSFISDGPWVSDLSKILDDFELEIAKINRDKAIALEADKEKQAEAKRQKIQKALEIVTVEGE